MLPRGVILTPSKSVDRTTNVSLSALGMLNKCNITHWHQKAETGIAGEELWQAAKLENASGS